MILNTSIHTQSSTLSHTHWTNSFIVYVWTYSHRFLVKLACEHVMVIDEKYVRRALDSTANITHIASLLHCILQIYFTRLCLSSSHQCGYFAKVRPVSFSPMGGKTENRLTKHDYTLFSNTNAFVASKRFESSTKETRGRSTNKKQHTTHSTKTTTAAHRSIKKITNIFHSIS